MDELDVERLPGGWFFLTSRSVAGVCLFGPCLEGLLAEAAVAIPELAREDIPGG